MLLQSAQRVNGNQPRKILQKCNKFLKHKSSPYGKLEAGIFHSMVYGQKRLKAHAPHTVTKSCIYI